MCLAVCDTAKVRFFKQITTVQVTQTIISTLFVILQKYDFSSKSQRFLAPLWRCPSCLWYCKSTIFQANHNFNWISVGYYELFVILQKYDFSSKSQLRGRVSRCLAAVCDTAKVRFFKQITTWTTCAWWECSCLWYCKSTIFQANHNLNNVRVVRMYAVCDTAKVRFFKQITTFGIAEIIDFSLFVILQKYDFSSKSQQRAQAMQGKEGCLRYCKSTIFQANHNTIESNYSAIRRINHYWLSRSYINRHIQIWVKNVILNLFAAMLRL